MINKSVPTTSRIQWEVFRVTDEFRAKQQAPVEVMQTSDDMIEFILANNYEYRMYRYLSEDGKNYKIGYGYGDPDVPQGMTEAEAYSEWIKEFKKKEDQFARQLPIDFISQSQFDALMSLYFTTGSWRYIPANSLDGNYDILSAVKLGYWEDVANMISDCATNRQYRQMEAAVMMLANYTTQKTRRSVLIDGIFFARSQYSAGAITDSFTKKQAEFGFYRQTGGVYLPNTPTLRMRQIKKLYPLR